MTEVGGEGTQGPSTTSSVETLESSDVAYDVAMRRLDEQMRQIDAIDAKIGALMTAVSAVMALFAGFAAVAVNSEEPVSVLVAGIFVAMVGVLYIGAMISGVRAYRFHEWQLGPNWDDLITYSKEYVSEAMRSWVAYACVSSLKNNKPVIGKKLDQAGWAIRFLAGQTFIASLGLLAIIITNAAIS